MRLIDKMKADLINSKIYKNSRYYIIVGLDEGYVRVIDWHSYKWNTGRIPLEEFNLDWIVTEEVFNDAMAKLYEQTISRLGDRYKSKDPNSS